jgi:hypothetical protein
LSEKDSCDSLGRFVTERCIPRHMTN